MQVCAIFWVCISLFIIFLRKTNSVFVQMSTCKCSHHGDIRGVNQYMGNKVTCVTSWKSNFVVNLKVLLVTWEK